MCVCAQCMYVYVCMCVYMNIFGCVKVHCICESSFIACRLVLSSTALHTCHNCICICVRGTCVWEAEGT